MSQGRGEIALSRLLLNLLLSTGESSSLSITGHAVSEQEEFSLYQLPTMAYEDVRPRPWSRTMATLFLSRQRLFFHRDALLRRPHRRNARTSNGSLFTILPISLYRTRSEMLRT
ncbi:hypothetical protein BV20DRAFT_299006 [Pilatotrama ljubarskyi]|nr:hypothetical protein BV20DRAFT_299006 [Pilatotrama ljubarskyi]